jgi:hypothetical protein
MGVLIISTWLGRTVCGGPVLAGGMFCIPVTGSGMKIPGSEACSLLL